MELRNLYYFLQVCEDKSFSAAAAKLYSRSRPISKSVKALMNENWAASSFKKAGTAFS